jgi:hypothetical protein
MNWLIIEHLLERFWKSETTLEEEQELKRAFLRDDLPTHLASFKNYFAYATEQSNIKHPQKDFEMQLSEKLDPIKKPIFTIPKLLAYAASLLILISSIFFLLNESNSPKYEPLTEKEMQIAQKYLGLLAKNMKQSLGFSNQHLEKFKLLNKGTHILKHYENTYNKQVKNLNRIEYINHSFTQLKYLKTFETSMKIIAL